MIDEEARASFLLNTVDLFENLLREMPGRLSPFVFTRSRDGKPYAKGDLNVLWNRACETVGVKINLYNGLKHSLGMRLLE